MFVFGGHVTRLDQEAGDNALQISDSFVIGSLPNELCATDHINHSCEPNCGFWGQIFLITLRDIDENEELCFDYAMCIGGDTPYSMNCKCGNPGCLKTVSHRDWKKPDLQKRYAGRFQWYLHRKISEKMA